MTAPAEFAGHTPGPWAHIGQFVTGRDGQRSEVAIVSQSSGRTVLSLGESPAQSLADITLIAAAPALLAERDALREQVAELAAFLAETHADELTSRHQGDAPSNGPWNGCSYCRALARVAV